jgi:hypothetical protein
LFGLGFTIDTPARGVYSDPVTVGAHIGTADGVPVKFTIGNQSLTAFTQHGVAHATFTLNQRPGDYALTATALGQSVAKDFEILRETSSLSATLVHPTSATARLVDADSGVGIAGRTLTFTDGGTVLGFAITDATGTATVHLRKAVKKGEVLTVSFAGDDYYISSAATATR